MKKFQAVEDARKRFFEHYSHYVTKTGNDSFTITDEALADDEFLQFQMGVNPEKIPILRELGAGKISFRVDYTGILFVDMLQ